MITVELTSQCHGNIKVPAVVISVLDFGSKITYSSPCPECGRLVVKDCTLPVARQLIEAGASWTTEGSVGSLEDRWTDIATERIRQAISRIDHPSNGEKP